MIIANGIDITAGTELEGELEFMGSIKTSHRGARPKKIVIGWSGSEMSGGEYSDYLARGTTGTHLYIDHEGTIFQYADLWTKKVQRHPHVDSTAIWIVLQNKGNPPEDPRVKRGTFHMQVNMQSVSALGATSDQLDSLESVVALICDSMFIPASIPRKDGNPVQHFLRPRTLDQFEGILLDFHVDRRVVSPGPGVLEMLDELELSAYEDEDEDEDEDDTDYEGEGEPVDEDEFNEAFPDPSE